MTRRRHGRRRGDVDPHDDVVCLLTNDTNRASVTTSPFFEVLESTRRQKTTRHIQGANQATTNDVSHLGTTDMPKNEKISLQ